MTIGQVVVAQASMLMPFDITKTSACAQRLRAARIIQGLAKGIKDEALRARFLAGPQIHPLMQHAQKE
jgi:hypothetical protein